MPAVTSLRQMPPFLNLQPPGLLNRQCAASLRPRAPPIRAGGLPQEDVSEGMSIRLLKPVSKASQRVLETLVGDLNVGDSKKVENSGAFMALHVEALQRTGAGVTSSRIPTWSSCAAPTAGARSRSRTRSRTA